MTERATSHEVNDYRTSRRKRMAKKTEITMVPLELLQSDGYTQARFDWSAAAAQDYADAYSTGGSEALPPLVVFLDPEEGQGGVPLYWVADGFHRIDGADTAGIKKLPCEVRRGSRLDAIKYALSANSAHGVPRTHRDKRKAVCMCLLHPELKELTSDEVAALCKVSRTLVGTLKRRMTKSFVEQATQENPTLSAADACVTLMDEENSSEREEFKDFKRREIKTNTTKKPEVEDADEPSEQIPYDSSTCGEDVPITYHEEPSMSAEDLPDHDHADQVGEQRDVLPLPAPVDRQGKAVPERLRDAFADGQLREYSQALLKVARHLPNVARWNPYLQPDEDLNLGTDSMIGVLERLASMIAESAPAEVHHKCKGKGCKECRTAGWLPAWRAEEEEIARGRA